jgi:hypothetical protein
MVVGVSALGLLPLATTTGCWSGPTWRQRVAVPAYWTPAHPAGQATFRQLAASAPATRIVVVNGSRSAPEVPYDPAWADAFRLLSASGVVALGYVDTGYFGIDLGPGAHATRADGPGRGRRSVAAWTAQIEHDVDQWYALYANAGVRGIFLDQATATCGPDGAYVKLYRSVVDRVRDRHPGAYLVLNPGRAAEKCYRPLADTLVTFEGSYRDYVDRVAPEWERTAPPDLFWHLIYGAPDEISMRRAVELSKARNVGHVYVTDDALSPGARGVTWTTMPSRPYWLAELAAVYG